MDSCNLTSSALVAVLHSLANGYIAAKVQNVLLGQTPMGNDPSLEASRFCAPRSVTTWLRRATPFSEVETSDASHQQAQAWLYGVLA